MKIFFPRISGVFVLALACVVSLGSYAQSPLEEPATPPTAEQPAAEQQQVNLDPLSEHLFPPELVMQQAEQLSLEAGQKKSIEDAVASAREKMGPLRDRLQTELDALSELLEDESSASAKIKEQMDKVLKEERNVKQLNLELLLYVRKQLNPNQKEALQELKGKIIAAQLLQRRLQVKAARVSQAMRNYTLLDGPPAGVSEKIKEFQQLTQQNKFHEAEAVLDEVLSQLEQNE